MSTLDTSLPRVKTGPGAKHRGGMTILEALRVALQGLGGNKLRAFLTMLGVIIDGTSVIAMRGFGQGGGK